MSADLNIGVCNRIQFKSSKRSYYNSKVSEPSNRDTEQRGKTQRKRHDKYIILEKTLEINS